MNTSLRRALLVSIITLGGVVSAVSATGVLAPTTDTAKTGVNDKELVQTGVFPVVTSVDLQLGADGCAAWQEKADPQGCAVDRLSAKTNFGAPSATTAGCPAFDQSIGTPSIAGTRVYSTTATLGSNLACDYTIIVSNGSPLTLADQTDSVRWQLRAALHRTVAESKAGHPPRPSRREEPRRDPAFHHPRRRQRRRRPLTGASPRGTRNRAVGCSETGHASVVAARQPRVAQSGCGSGSPTGTERSSRTTASSTGPMPHVRATGRPRHVG